MHSHLADEHQKYCLRYPYYILATPFQAEHTWEGRPCLHFPGFLLLLNRNLPLPLYRHNHSEACQVLGKSLDASSKLRLFQALLHHQSQLQNKAFRHTHSNLQMPTQTPLDMHGVRVWSYLIGDGMDTSKSKSMVFCNLLLFGYPHHPFGSSVKFGASLHTGLHCVPILS